MSENLEHDQEQHHKKKKDLGSISHKILKCLRLPHHNFKRHRDQKYRQREEEVALPGPVLTHHMITPGDLAMDQVAQEQVHQEQDEIMNIHQTNDYVKRQEKTKEKTINTLKI